jgi:hypothetical protein
MATAGPVHRVQSAVEVYGYPQGHIGHMTPEEEAALKNFKTLLIEKNLYSPKTDNDEYGTHDDATLLYGTHCCLLLCLSANNSDGSFALAASRCKKHSSSSKTQKTGATRIN